MDTRLIEALIRSLEQEPAVSAIDLVRRTKIIVKTCSDKNTNERILITKILMIISRGRDGHDGVTDLVTPEIMYGIRSLVDGGLVGQIADEITVKIPWFKCC